MMYFMYFMCFIYFWQQSTAKVYKNTNDIRFAFKFQILRIRIECRDYR